jgi:hypothetical protein
MRGFERERRILLEDDATITCRSDDRPAVQQDFAACRVFPPPKTSSEQNSASDRTGLQASGTLLR